TRICNSFWPRGYFLATGRSIELLRVDDRGARGNAAEILMRLYEELKANLAPNNFSQRYDPARKPASCRIAPLRRVGSDPMGQDRARRGGRRYRIGIRIHDT